MLPLPRPQHCKQSERYEGQETDGGSRQKRNILPFPKTACCWNQGSMCVSARGAASEECWTPSTLSKCQRKIKLAAWADFICWDSAHKICFNLCAWSTKPVLGWFPNCSLAVMVWRDWLFIYPPQKTEASLQDSSAGLLYKPNLPLLSKIWGQ